jgi:hypothetical protein
VATIDGVEHPIVEHPIHAGDALIVPAHVSFALANPSSEAFEAVVTLPVGGQAVTKEATFTPPWAE